MLTNVIFSFRLRNYTVLNLILWKYSFNRLKEEFEMAKKKKQALDNLFETGRISQTTHNNFDNDISAVILDIEKQQQALLNKMQNTTQELDSQISILESLLANYELQHAVGEIEEDIYQSEIGLLNSGLETARRELEKVNDAVSQLSPPIEPKIDESLIDSVPTCNEPLEETNIPIDTSENFPETKDDITSTPELSKPEPSLILDAPLPDAFEIETSDPISQESPQIVDESVQVADVVPEVVDGDVSVDESVQVADVVPEPKDEIHLEQTNKENETITEDESDEWPQFMKEKAESDENPEMATTEPLSSDQTNQSVEDSQQETIFEEQ